MPAETKIHFFDKDSKTGTRCGLLFASSSDRTGDRKKVTCKRCRVLITPRVFVPTHFSDDLGAPICKNISTKVTKDVLAVTCKVCRNTGTFPLRKAQS